MADQVSELLAGLLKAAGIDPKSAYEKVDSEVERHGKKIVLPNDPAPMEIKDAINTLKRVEKDEQQVFDLHEVIDAHPYDALVAFNKAMKDLYGWSSPVPTPGFFGPTPPSMISVPVGPDPKDVIQVPYGSFKLPAVEQLIHVGIGRHKNRYALHVKGQARRAERHFLLELVNRARDFVKKDSIYRGKAVAAKASGNELNQELTFFDVRKVSKQEVILNEDTLQQIQVNLWAPVERTAECRKHKIPLKRGVLLEGKYGTGKSLTARITAKVCQDNGWTFLHVDNVEALGAALVFAEQYQPCVVFAEDIDRVLDERDEAANEIVNTLDGVLSKTAEVLVVLTTNHVDKIEPVMLRPGRLDAVITLDPPNASTVEKLIHVYGAGLVADNEDLTAVCKELAGQIPATIREVVERSKLAMISEGGDRVSAMALLIAAKGMTAHLRLLNQPKDEPTDAEVFYNSFKKLVGNGGSGVDVEDIVEDINNNTDAEASATREVAEGAVGHSEKRTAARLQRTQETILEKLEEVADRIIDAA